MPQGPALARHSTLAGCQSYFAFAIALRLQSNLRKVEARSVVFGRSIWPTDGDGCGGVGLAQTKR